MYNTRNGGFDDLENTNVGIENILRNYLKLIRF